MTHFQNNLKFIGYSLFPKRSSKKLKDFNKTKLAEYLEMDLTALIRWINGTNPISKINLTRITNKISDHFKMKIPSEIVLKGNLKKYIDDHKQSYQYITTDLERTMIADRRSIIDEINFLLNKHPELQTIIYELLSKYDKK